jgi:hypothetical protein
MSIMTKLATSVVATLAVSTIMLAPVQASAATTCSVKMNGTTNTANQTDSRWSLSTSGVATGTFTVTGDDDCTQTVTLSAWQAPDGVKGQPYSQQKLVSHVSGTFGPGTHNLSIQIPDCFYQLDMIPGANPTGPDGSAQYTVGSLIGSLHGGTQTCEVTPPQTPPQTPETPAAPTALPNTGVGSNVVVAGLFATVLGTAFAYLRRMRTV